MNEARDGMHSGPWHETRENRTPSAARASSDGVSDGRVAGAAHHVGSVLVRHDEQDVGSAVTHELRLPVSCDRVQRRLRIIAWIDRADPNERPNG